MAFYLFNVENTAKLTDLTAAIVLVDHGAALALWVLSLCQNSNRHLICVAYECSHPGDLAAEVRAIDPSS